jgi:hypothetical protein
MVVLAGGNAGGGYRPLPMQQGSLPQMGAPPPKHVPMGSQQQHPLQSIHVGTCGSG